MTTIEELRALLEEATPGKWTACVGEAQPQILYYGLIARLEASPERHVTVVTDGRAVEIAALPANAELIAAARNALPALLRVVEAAQAYTEAPSEANWRERQALSAALSALGAPGGGQGDRE